MLLGGRIYVEIVTEISHFSWAIATIVKLGQLIIPFHQLGYRLLQLCLL